MGGEPGIELGEGFGHIGTAVAKADVTGLIVDGAGKEKNAGLLNEGFAELEYVVLWLELDKADGAGVRRSPGEQLGVANEKSGEKVEIAQDELTIAVDNLIAVA